MGSPRRHDVRRRVHDRAAAGAARGPSARGWTNYRTRVVWVGNEHGEAESLRVLAHEYAGHIRADHEGRKISREQRETEADSIAYLVLKALGFDISSSTVDYLAGWLPDDKDMHAAVIRAAAETVRNTAVAVLAEIEGGE